MATVSSNDSSSASKSTAISTVPAPIPSEEKPKPQPPPDDQPTGRWTWIGRIALGLIVGAALGYLGGRIHGAVATNQVETEMRNAARLHDDEVARLGEEHRQEIANKDAAYAELEATLADARETIANQRTLIATEEVYRTMIHAVLALDARNFGIAEAHVREAETMLSRIESATSEHRTLLADLRELEIVVAGNLSRQRSRVSAFIPRLDRIIDALHEALPAEDEIEPETEEDDSEIVPTGLPEQSEPAPRRPETASESSPRPETPPAPRRVEPAPAPAAPAQPSSPPSNTSASPARATPPAPSPVERQSPVEQEAGNEPEPSTSATAPEAQEDSESEPSETPSAARAPSAPADPNAADSDE